MQRLEVSGAVRPIYGSLGVKELNKSHPTIRILGITSHLNVLCQANDTKKQNSLSILNNVLTFPLCKRPVVRNSRLLYSVHVRRILFTQSYPSCG